MSNDETNLEISTFAHLRRILLTQKSSTEQNCEFVLLLPLTRFGKLRGANHVVLSGSHEFLSTVRTKHASICGRLDPKKKHLIYEITPLDSKATVFVNNCEIYGTRQLLFGDYVAFGDQLDFGQISFLFKFERANSKFEYPVILENLKFGDSPHKMQSLILMEKNLSYKIGDVNRMVKEDLDLVEANCKLPQDRQPTQQPQNGRSNAIDVNFVQQLSQQINQRQLLVPPTFPISASQPATPVTIDGQMDGVRGLLPFSQPTDLQSQPVASDLLKLWFNKTLKNNNDFLSFLQLLSVYPQPSSSVSSPLPLISNSQFSSLTSQHTNVGSSSSALDVEEMHTPDSTNHKQTLTKKTSAKQTAKRLKSRHILKQSLKYIANNAITTQIVQHTRRHSSLTERLLANQKELLISVEQNLEDPTEAPAFDSLTSRTSVEPRSSPPQPLNLYENGEFACPPIKRGRPKKKAIAPRVDPFENEPVIYSAEEQRLLATMLLDLRQSTSLKAAQSTLDSQQLFPYREQTNRQNNGPTEEEQEAYKYAEETIPHLNGIGRHMMAKYRAMYRAEVDTTDAETMLAQRFRVNKKLRAMETKAEKAAKRREEAKKKKESTGCGRGRKKKVATVSPRIQKKNTKQKSASAANSLISPIASSSRSTAVAAVNVHQLAKDANFDSFLTTENADPFSFEEEDPFHVDAPPADDFISASFYLDSTRRAAQTANVRLQRQTQNRVRKLEKRRHSNAAENVKRKKSNEDEKCSWRNVVLKAGKEPIEWVACDGCNDWFHSICVFNANRMVPEKERFQCSQCLKS
ncbi:hypothetical protein M3Y98_00760900 [Aphelenchoides besseyi]|nr:hypothetical protein M3Y98_00760900 [Aphelenchoides besseyi]KAI6211643.1 hypothetical protein M3Y96_00456000 [Aphelenchoides besseyi]